MKQYLKNFGYLLAGLILGGLASLIIPPFISLLVAFLFLLAVLFLIWFLKNQPDIISLGEGETDPFVQQQVDSAVKQERERIYRNLHDDIGAQLLTLVYQAKDSEAADQARMTLQTMREVIAKTVDKRLILSELLADMREEMEARLSAVGIDLSWKVAADLPEDLLPPDQVISINRIFREALSNCLKHAEASMVTFCVRVENDSLQLILKDNGRLKVNGRPGRGLESMQARAKKMGARLKIDNEMADGFQVKLILPRTD